MDSSQTLEFRCQVPMYLSEFQQNLQRGFGHRSIIWNLTALDPMADLKLRLVQISIGSVFPGASLVIPGSPRSQYEIPLKPLTLEMSWLDSLRDADTLELLPPEQRLVMRLNENYHLFTLNPGDFARFQTADPFANAMSSGAYVFTTKKMGFMVSKNGRFLTICPRTYDGKVELTSKQMAAETVKFLIEQRVVDFLTCELLLKRRKI